MNRSLPPAHPNPILTNNAPKPTLLSKFVTDGGQQSQSFAGLCRIDARVLPKNDVIGVEHRDLIGHSDYYSKT